MPQTDPWTIGRLLEWTTSYLKGRGADSPRLDAEVLLAEAYGGKRIDLYMAFDEVPSDEARTAFRELVRRRAEGTPVAYLVGRKEFYSLSFRVNDHVLIPRPETEFLVIEALDFAKTLPNDAPPHIADIGTGSGAIAVSLAKHLPGALITAVDVSTEALEIATANANDLDVADRIEFVQSDLFESLSPKQTFDIVVSNPPYVSEEEYGQLPATVKDYEPQRALLAGPSGTEVIERLIDESAGRLRPGGRLLIEISPMIHEAVFGRLESDDRYEALATVKDMAGLERVVRAARK